MISRRKEYLSVDIVIPIEDHERIDDAMKAAPEYLKTHRKCKRLDIDYEELEKSIDVVCQAFMEKMQAEGPG